MNIFENIQVNYKYIQVYYKNIQIHSNTFKYIETHWNKVRAPIPLVYASFYTIYYKDIGEFQILYLQDICW
jgi:hypothetical protein